MAGPLAAQAPAAGAVITGVVRDALGTAVGGATVSSASGGAPATTNAGGEFRIGGVPGGPTVVQVRRLGFRPHDLKVELGAGDSLALDLRLAVAARQLEPVVVRAGRARYTGRLAGYYQRLERRSGGQFITRADIDREQPRLLTNMLQRLPGLQNVRARGVGATGIRMRGRSCSPLVWVDGTAAVAGEIDLDSFAPSEIEGIELYLGATNAPNLYQWTRESSNCGTILIWSREAAARRARTPVVAERAADAAVDTAVVRSAGNVDIAVRPDSAAPLSVPYPPALRADGVSGLVDAEFVVDSAGRVVPGTVSVIFASDPLFSEAVEVALTRAAFRPAMRGGRRVPQLVQQAFAFEAAAPKRARE